MRINIQNKNLFEKVIQQILPELSIPQYTGVTIDSRKVEPGDIFLALKGENTDGHHYIEQAQNAGASICIVEKDSDIYNSAFEVSSTRQFLNDTSMILNNF